MPLIRTRPTFRLRAPRDVVPGTQFEIAVLIDARKEVSIEWCDVRVSGYEFYGKGFSNVISPLEARVCGPREIPIGTTTLPCRVALPIDAPRSHRGPGTTIRYVAAVHASVPWWPDARGEFALHVVGAPSPPLEGRARVSVSRMDGPIEGEPYAEISVGTDVAELGGVLDGSVAIRGAPGTQRTVSLVAYEKNAYRTDRVGAWTIPLGVGDGSTTPFAFRVPEDITPTMKSASVALDYWLVAEARSSLLRSVSASVPVRIVDRGGAVSTARVVAPHVGDERLEHIFTSVGEAEGASVEPGPTLVIRRGVVVARATRELGRDGTRMAVRIAYPALHLDIQVNEPTLIALAPRARRVAKKAGLSSRCVVSARDDAQAAAFLAAFAAPLSRARDIDMNDTALRYVVPTPANDRGSVGRVVREMRELAEALGVAPPLPTLLQPSHAEWSELAAALSGTLEVARARVIASAADAEIEIETVFDAAGAPTGTVVTTRPTRELQLDAPIEHAGEEALPDLGLSPDARAAVERLARFGRVSITASAVRVSLELPLGPALPPSRGREVVLASLRLAAALRPSSGPFR